MLFNTTSKYIPSTKDYMTWKTAIPYNHLLWFHHTHRLGLRYKPRRPHAPSCDAGMGVGRKLLEPREEGRSPSTPQDLSAGVCSQKQKNNSEEEIKIGKRHVNVRAAFKDGAIKLRGW